MVKIIPHHRVPYKWLYNRPSWGWLGRFYGGWAGLFIGLILLTGCYGTTPLPPSEAQQIIHQAWQASQHGVWEVTWPEVPIGKLFVVEVWRVSPQYRYELLEATSSNLLGEVMVSNGDTVWRYNRFHQPIVVKETKPRLSPLSDIFNIIEKQLAESAVAGQIETTDMANRTTQKIILLFENQDQLTVWLDKPNQLPLQIEISYQNHTINLKARYNYPLIDISPHLFSPPTTD